jgi:hypothetical protein
MCDDADATVQPYYAQTQGFARSTSTTGSPYDYPHNAHRRHRPSWPLHGIYPTPISNASCRIRQPKGNATALRYSSNLPAAINSKDSRLVGVDSLKVPNSTSSATSSSFGEPGSSGRRIASSMLVWRCVSSLRVVSPSSSIIVVRFQPSSATSLTLAVFNFKSEFHGVHYTRLTQNFLGTFGLLVTNFTATVLISYKLWFVRDCFAC